MFGNLQLLLMVLGVIAVYALARIFFSRDAEENALRSAEPLSEAQRFVHTLSASSSLKNDRSSAPVSDNLGRVRVTQFNFAHFDAVPGPPDPESFADELILELYDSVSDFRWTVTYVVATPAGIRKLMDEERWSFFHASEIFIVRRYDLQTIRDAVFGRIKEIHDEVPLDPEVPPSIRG
jgi:hypothetical protein